MSCSPILPEVDQRERILVVRERGFIPHTTIKAAATQVGELLNGIMFYIVIQCLSFTCKDKLFCENLRTDKFKYTATSTRFIASLQTGSNMIWRRLESLFAGHTFSSVLKTIKAQQILASCMRLYSLFLYKLASEREINFTVSIIYLSN